MNLRVIQQGFKTQAGWILKFLLQIPLPSGIPWRISREMQFGVHNHGEACARPCTAKEGGCFYREEKEVGVAATVNKESVASHWLSSARKEAESFFFLLGSAIVAGCESSPCWSPDSIRLRLLLFINFFIFCVS